MPTKVGTNKCGTCCFMRLEIYKAKERFHTKILPYLPNEIKQKYRILTY